MDNEEYEWVDVEEATWQDIFLDEEMVDHITLTAIEMGLDLNQTQLRKLASIIIPPAVGRAMAFQDRCFESLFSRDADDNEDEEDV